MKFNWRLGGKYDLRHHSSIILSRQQLRRWQAAHLFYAVYLQQTALRYIPGATTSHIHRCEGPKSYTLFTGSS
jgi:hypothetical protein